MRLVVRLLRAGIVHGDFNEFNLMLDQAAKGLRDMVNGFGG